MYPQDELVKQMQHDILSRLKKIEGQIRGLQGMIAAEKECEQILIQTKAAQSALKGVGRLILKTYLVKCYGKGFEKQAPEEVLRHLDETVGMLTKFID